VQDAGIFACPHLSLLSRSRSRSRAKPRRQHRKRNARCGREQKRKKKEAEKEKGDRGDVIIAPAFSNGATFVRSFVRSFICSLRSLELNFATLRCCCARVFSALIRQRLNSVSIGTSLLRLATISGLALPTLRGARHADVRYN